jgi:hypothetical protein
VVSVCVSTGLTKILPATTTSTDDIKESSIEILFPLHYKKKMSQINFTENYCLITGNLLAIFIFDS